MAGMRVFVCWTHPLFYESVRRLLQHPEVALVGHSSNYTSSLKQIEALKPDAVIIEQTERTQEFEGEALGGLQSGSMVISLNLTDNKLSVYSKRQQTVVDAEDLLRIILEGENPP